MLNNQPVWFCMFLFSPEFCSSGIEVIKRRQPWISLNVLEQKGWSAESIDRKVPSGEPTKSYGKWP